MRRTQRAAAAAVVGGIDCVVAVMGIKRAEGAKGAKEAAGWPPFSSSPFLRSLLPFSPLLLLRH